MTPAAQQQLIKTLNEGISRFTHLYVRDCDLARQARSRRSFAYAGRADSPLEHIDVACNQLDTIKLVQHVGACVLDSPSLRTLHVAATGLTNETLMPILRAARDSRCLKHLHLDGHPKAKRWLPLMTKLVATSKSGIEELTLRNCNVTEDDAIQLRRVLSHAHERRVRAETAAIGAQQAAGEGDDARGDRGSSGSRTRGEQQVSNQVFVCARPRDVGGSCKEVKTRASETKRAL
jgi:hypothetical protein